MLISLAEIQEVEINAQKVSSFANLNYKYPHIDKNKKKNEVIDKDERPFIF